MTNNSILGPFMLCALVEFTCHNIWIQTERNQMIALKGSLPLRGLIASLLDSLRDYFIAKAKA